MKNLPTLILATVALSLAVATNSKGAVTPAIVPKLLTTFTNPTPAANNFFGRPVAVVGTDRVLIGAYRDDAGAPYTGAAYLFSTNGALLTIFTNPTPASADDFGISMVAVGEDRVLIGAPGDDTGVINAGAAHLFSVSGSLLCTFTNPTPASDDWFGGPVAAVGTDRVLIGAPYDSTGNTYAGAAYLFSTNGALITTFTNPTPAAYDLFGGPVAAVGTDQVLIGAFYDDTGADDAGAAYLFSTNGTLLTTFTNPTAASRDFGRSVAAVGTDRVLIGAPFDGGDESYPAAAYLFNTNGTLLTTFTNSSADSGFLGISVAIVGTDRVLLGVPLDDTGAGDAAAAYLFSINGVLLATFTNPTPDPIGLAGWSVAAMGTDRVLIGPCLFSLEPFTPAAPSLSTSRDPSLSTLTISWPAPAEGWLLEGTNTLPSVPASSWPPVPPPYQTNAGTISVTLTNPPATGNQFFRLRQP